MKATLAFAKPGAALVAVLVLMVTGLAGCSSTPKLSNASVSVCFRAIPVGRSSLHNNDVRLVGVHELPLGSVRLPLSPAEKGALSADKDTEICAMAFQGDFAAGQVELAPPTQAGKFAVVLVSAKNLHLVASVVLSHVPRGFGGRGF